LPLDGWYQEVQCQRISRRDPHFSSEPLIHALYQPLQFVGTALHALDHIQGGFACSRQFITVRAAQEQRGAQ
jgi:hypothetical protein